MSIRQPPQAASPTSDRLTLIEHARQAVFQSDGMAAAARLEPWIERSWRRCLAQGLQPDQRLAFDPVSSVAMRRVIEANQPLLRAAAPVIQQLARAMADTRYFAILTDAQGVVIDVNGPIDHHNRLAHLIARVGVDLSEQAVGTTAIGATLVEQQPVWLHRGEHFFDDTSAYSCAGAPLFGPDGRCVGMLDLTGINVPERPALKHLVTQSALSIENALTLAQPHHLLLRLNWPGRTPGEESDGLVCLDADGRITGANRAAADMLTLPAGAPWPHCSDVIAVPPDSLFDAARAQRGAVELPLWSGLRLQVLARLNDGRASTAASQRPLSTSVPLKDVETALIRRAVEEARGNVMEAARVLGISRATVYRKIGRR
ncbi:MAG: helix-turn-helix domain-containing protein [Hydrogenophaga sp.]|uniref:helix-turn-helix domain-containing protein n=1 Tax=Hydrogenophaga sp. TaxID=1904254 RepID=UPI002723E55E|nr:helix-turn-helix domain-containing protein [Hydrogenophaga sp.]MDO9031522.1 helix-turn-helix domain-containing protein [Hydrogenophaga sp.]